VSNITPLTQSRIDIVIRNSWPIKIQVATPNCCS